MEEKQLLENHKIAIQSRKQSQFTGVREVISFDAKEVVLDTAMGILIIRGEDLFIRRLTVEKGEVDLDGQVDSLVYSGKSGKQDSLLKRLFR